MVLGGASVLRELAVDPAYALEIGRASEHLVVVDLITQGYRAFLTDQGLPYGALAGKPNGLGVKGRKAAIRRSGQLTLLAGGLRA